MRLKQRFANKTKLLSNDVSVIITAHNLGPGVTQKASTFIAEQPQHQFSTNMLLKDIFTTGKTLNYEKATFINLQNLPLSIFYNISSVILQVVGKSSTFIDKSNAPCWFSSAGR